MSESAPTRARVPVILFLLGALASVAFMPECAAAQARQGDRFGIRVGIWPQGDVVGTFGKRSIYPTGESLTIRINEDSKILPFLEVYGLFHLGNKWWVEGSAGWSGRNDVQVGGFKTNDSLLLGNGRVDFFPLFAGIRAIQPLGGKRKPHNVYARAGGSLVFANESPDLVYDSVLKYNIYNSGTEGAFGFLVGAGAEFYFARTVAAVADVQYRYVNFVYGREAEFNVSSFWLALGLTLRTR